MISIYYTCSNKKLGFIPSEWDGISTNCATSWAFWVGISTNCATSWASWAGISTNFATSSKPSKRVSTDTAKLIAGVFDNSKITTINIVC